MSDLLRPHGSQHARLPCSSPFTISQSLLKLTSIELVMPSSQLILCRPLLLWPSIFPSTGVFSSELTLCIRWPKYWSFSFSISPSNEYSEVIPFRIILYQCPPRGCHRGMQCSNLSFTAVILAQCRTLISEGWGGWGWRLSGSSADKRFL